MTGSRSIKKALISSMLAMLMCAAMLIGTTFAWFTDTASTAVNKIEAGNLKIELWQADNDSKLGSEPLKWVSADNRAQDDILWEPGCTYNLESFRIKNNGNLALKYKVVINGLVGSAKLLEAIDFTVSVDGTPLVAKDGTSAVATVADLNNFEGKLGAREVTGKITVTGKMKTTAGSEYMGEKIEGISFTVYATQDTVENDSHGNQYDKDAEYDDKIIVNDAAQLTEALKNAAEGKTVCLGSNITVDRARSIGKKLTVDLNGHALSGTATVTLRLNSGADVTVIDTSADKSGLITNTYGGSRDPATIDLKSGSTFTLQSGTVQSNPKDDLQSVAIRNNDKKECTVNINGGTVSNHDGQENSRAIVASNGMTVNINGGIVSGGLYAVDAYDGSVVNIIGGKLFANALVRRNDEYGTSYAIHAKGKATINIGAADSESIPNVKGIKFVSNGRVTSLPTINLIKGEITNPIYSLETKANYKLFKLGITADAPVTFTDNTANLFLADGLKMVQNGSVWTVTAE